MNSVDFLDDFPDFNDIRTFKNCDAIRDLFLFPNIFLKLAQLVRLSTILALPCARNLSLAAVR